jgi:hypothetical protein
MHLRPIAICVSLILTISFVPAPSVVAEASESPAFLFTTAKQYDPLAWMHASERFSGDAAIFVQDAGGARPLLPTFAESADPSVSFDGTNVLFAGKQKTNDLWQVWEVPVYGSEPQRITACTTDCVRPLYLPDNHIVYAEKVGGRYVIEMLDRQERKSVQLTWHPGNSLPTDVLRDGRVLFESSYPLGTGSTPEIYTVYSDGSGMESYRCDHGRSRYEGKQVVSGDIVFTSGAGLARFTSAAAHELFIPSPAGEYAGEIAESSHGDWLVARRERNRPFELVWWKPGSAAFRPAFANPDVNAVEPALIAERKVPNRHPSGLHDWPNANLLCLNAYTSKYKFGSGSIHFVRFYTHDNGGNVKRLGTTEIERDGSFFVQVPTEQPLQVEMLDGSGKTLKREAGWFWMRRGEQRVCVGCHAGPEIAPENAVPMTLLKSTTPADMTGTIRSSAGGQ